MAVSTSPPHAASIDLASGNGGAARRFRRVRQNRHIDREKAGALVGEHANSLRAALAIERDAFDVLLSDVGLTDGSGLDLMRTLRKAGQVKGIALSGFGTEDDVRASKEAGFAQHITKPVNFGALLEAIAELGAS